MKRALSSFVIISNSLNAGNDSIEAFVPFVIHLFDIKRYNNVSVETICKDFADQYGIQIPRHPMETILNRMKPKYLAKESGKIIINIAEIQKRAKAIDFETETRKYDWLIENFIDFCKNFPTPANVSYEEADSLFVSFLKDHDMDVIFAAYVDENDSLLVDSLQVEDSDKIFLLNRYVNMLLEKGGEHAEYLIDSAVGHKYASLLLYREFANIRGKGTCANYYLDTGILFDIMGINKTFRKKAAEDLLSLLKSKGSSLWVFRHTYDEFQRIVEGCLTWVENNRYDPSRASRALQHFKDEGYGVAEVQLLISQIDAVLEKNNIKISNPLDPNADQYYQIGREELRKTILGVYNSGGFYFDIDDKGETLQKDELSIESVYKLRRGNVPTNLNNTTHVFVTTNAGLAYASTKFERDIWNRGFFTIPAALTDTFVGTVIWAEEPSRLVKQFNKSKLIAYTNAMIQPRTALMSRFAQEVDRAKKNEINPISNESAYLLLTSPLPRNLLADKTLGDPNRITTQTPYEMLKEVEQTLTKQERAKTEEVLREAESIRIGKENVENTLSRQGKKITNFITAVALWAKRVTIGIFFVIAAIFYAIAEFQEPKTTSIKFIEYSLSVLSLLSGITIVVLGQQVENFVIQRLGKYLTVSNKDE